MRYGCTAVSTLPCITYLIPVLQSTVYFTHRILSGLGMWTPDSYHNLKVHSWTRPIQSDSYGNKCDEVGNELEYTCYPLLRQWMSQAVITRSKILQSFSNHHSEMLGSPKTPLRSLHLCNSSPLNMHLFYGQQRRVLLNRKQVPNFITAQQTLRRQIIDSANSLFVFDRNFKLLHHINTSVCP